MAEPENSFSSVRTELIFEEAEPSKTTYLGGQLHLD